MKMIFNGTWLPHGDLALSPHDRALGYGDGLFETIVCQRGELSGWASHMARLHAGMAALWMQPSAGFTPNFLASQARQLLQANELTGTARLRLQVWRAVGGLYTPTSSGINYLITAQACTTPSVSVKAKVQFYEAVRLHASPISAYKTCNALPYVLAGLAKTHANVADVILLDTDGNLAECVASNLFWLKDGIFYTPALSTGCVAGIRRAQILQRLRASGRRVVEGHFPKEAIMRADGAFCCNVAGMEWLGQVENYSFPIDAWDAATKEVADW
jgi:branched-chain amino acid aminotransferase/4-amino-4-deoxychorismate lyase